MKVRRLHFEAAIPEQPPRRLRENQVSRVLITGGVLAVLAWSSSGLTLDPRILDYGSERVGGATKLQVVELGNRSSNDVHPIIKVEGISASDFDYNHQACATIGRGETCRFPVEFRPQEPGEKHAQLVVSLGNSESTAELTGTALQAAVQVSPGNLDFGSVPVGELSAPQYVTLEGEGWFHVHGASVKGAGQGEYRVEVAECTQNTGEIKECKIGVWLQPRSEGTFEASLLVNDDGLQGPHTVLLRGSGAKLASTQLSPVPTSSPTPTPVPTSTAPPSPVPTSPPPPSPVPTSTSPPTSTPTPNPNADSDKTPSDSTPTPNPPVEGSGVHSGQPVTIRIEPAVLDFSAQPQQAQQVRIWNAGSSLVLIKGVTVQGDDRDRFRVDGTCQEIRSGGECLITVRYQSSIFHAKRSYSAALQVDHNAQNVASPHSIALRWARVESPQPHVSVSPPSLSFFGVGKLDTTTQLPSQTITIRNDGPVELQNLSLRLGAFRGGESRFFQHTSNCRRLQPGQACREEISFSAAKAQKYTGTLYVTEAAFQVLATVPLEATLTAPAVPPIQMPKPVRPTPTPVIIK